jgi:hypothetical protein
LEKQHPVVFGGYSATGVLHVHTKRSDGLGEPEDIVCDGVAAGLDFIAFNDHRNLDLMREGWHGRNTAGLLTIVGAELQHTDYKSHLLVYGVDEIKPSGHILDQLNRVLSMNGLAIIAHPREVRPVIPGIGGFPWRFGTDHPVSGVEGWNWMSSWKRRVDPVNAWNRISYPDDMVRHPNKDAVDMWFETGGCLVGGADAHGHRIMGNDVFNYKMLFNRVRTHILLDEPLREPSQFTGALRQGRCFVSNALEGDASGYRSLISEGKLYLKLPGAARVTFREKGEPFRPPLFMEEGVHCLGPAVPPLYIEIYRRGRTWIAQGHPGPLVHETNNSSIVKKRKEIQE